MPKYSVELSDGTKKTIYWDKPREPTDQELMDAPDYVESKPSIVGSFMKGVSDPLTSMYESVNETGKSASKHIREGNYPAAFGDITAPIMHPLEGIMDYLGGKKPVNPGTQLTEQAGIPLTSMKKAYNEGDYPRLAGQAATTLGLLGLSAAKGGMKEGISKLTDKYIPNKPTTKEIPIINKPYGPGDYAMDNAYSKARGYGNIYGPELTSEAPVKPLGPPEITPFESLSKEVQTPEVAKQSYKGNPETETTGLRPFQQGLNIQFEENPAIQPQLPGINVSPQQSSFDALVPDRYKAPDPIQLNQPELFQAPGEPKIIPNERPTWSNFAQQRNLPLDFDVLNDAEISEVPEIAQAAKQVVERDATSPLTSARQKKIKEMNKWRNTEENFKSNLAVLKSDSPAGASIVNLIDQFRARRNTLYGHASAALKDVYDPLTPIQKSQAQSLIDMGGSSQDPMVQNAVDAFRKVSDTTADMATKSGMKIKLPDGVKIPFTGRDAYWAHIYDPAMFPDREALISRLIKEDGYSPDAAKKAVDNMGKTGERLIDPEHARQANTPGYRTDLGSQLHHYDDMAHRISSAEIFGPEDISDPTSPISQLIARTKNPERVTKIISQYLGRDNHPMPHEVNFVNKLKTASTAYYLSKFALTNTSQVAMTPLVTNLNSTARAIGKFIANPKATTRAAERTGSLQTVEHMVRTQGGDKALSKLFLMKASESATRTISSIAGDLYVQDLFNKLKKNPTNARLRADIQKLTLDHADEILGQDALTEKQREYASNRVNELSQGYAESVDLPYNWSRSPYVDILTLYKKFAFTQSRLAKDAIKANPAKALPLFIGLGLIRGEATGQLKGMITGNTMEEKAKNVGSNSKLLNRIVADMAEGQFLGLAADAMLAGSKSTGLAELVSGPIIGLAGRTAYNSYQDVKNIPTISKDFTKSKLLQQVVPNRVKKAMTSKVKTGS